MIPNCEERKASYRNIFDCCLYCLKVPKVSLLKLLHIHSSSSNTAKMVLLVVIAPSVHQVSFRLFTATNSVTPHNSLRKWAYFVCEEMEVERSLPVVTQLSEAGLGGGFWNQSLCSDVLNYCGGEGSRKGGHLML